MATSSNNRREYSHPMMSLFLKLQEIILRRWKLGFQREALFILSVKNKDFPVIPAPDIAVKVELLDETADTNLLSAHARLINLPSGERVKELMAQGRKCCYLTHEGEIVSLVWVCSGGYYDWLVHRQILLAEDEIYYLNAYTDPRYRGHGLIPYLHSTYVRQFSKNDPGTNLLVFIKKKNSPSLHASAKLGFRIVGQCGSLSVFGLGIGYLFGKDVLPLTPKGFWLFRTSQFR